MRRRSLSKSACMSFVGQTSEWSSKRASVQRSLGTTGAPNRCTGITWRPLNLIGKAKWAAYRDAECGFRSARFGDGTGAPAEGMGCEVELGRARLDYLATL